MLTQKIVREKFKYINGQLYTVLASGKVAKNYLGQKASGLHRPKAHVDRVAYGLYRIIFLYHHGYMPNHIDHIDGDFMNNRIENLRECTNQQNQLNKKSKPNSSSQYKGVFWNKPRKRWTATGKFEGKKKHLGHFKVEEDAARAYDNYMKQFDSEFIYLNFP